jgi:hypothetical protein
MHVTTSTLCRLADGIWHASGFAHAHPDLALIVTHYSYDAKTEAPSALNHRSDSRDIDDSLVQIILP